MIDPLWPDTLIHAIVKSTIHWPEARPCGVSVYGPLALLENWSFSLRSPPGLSTTSQETNAAPAIEQPKVPSIAIAASP